MKPRPKKQMKESIHLFKTTRKPGKDAILVDTSKMNKKQTVDFILKNLE